MTAEHLRVILESEADTCSLSGCTRSCQSRSSSGCDCITSDGAVDCVAEAYRWSPGDCVWGHRSKVGLTDHSTVSVHRSAGSHISVPVRSDDEVGQRVCRTVSHRLEQSVDCVDLRRDQCM